MIYTNQCSQTQKLSLPFELFLVHHHSLVPLYKQPKPNMSCVHVHAFLASILVSLLVSRSNAKVPAIIVFGDSSVDAGNNNVISTVLRSNFQPYGRDFVGARPTGRFSNGRIPPDFVSEAFGLKPTVPAYLDPMYNISDFATGVCFASAGTGYDNATSNVLVSRTYKFNSVCNFC